MAKEKEGDNMISEYVISMTVIAFVSVLAVISIVVILFENSKLQYQTNFEVVIVCGKEYVPEYRSPIIIPGLPLSAMLINHLHYEAEYNIFLMYEGKKYCINDRNLYQSVDIGNTISVCMHRACDKKGKEHIYFTAD